MQLYSASSEEIHSHLHNRNCYTCHPSGKTDSHITGCRITLSQQDRNEHGQGQNICDNTEYLHLAPAWSGAHSQCWPPFTESSTGTFPSSSTFMLHISCPSKCARLGDLLIWFAQALSTNGPFALTFVFLTWYRLDLYCCLESYTLASTLDHIYLFNDHIL